MAFGQVHLTLRRVQVRMSHQSCNAEHVDAGFDGPRSIGILRIGEPESWFDPAAFQGPEMRRLELRYQSGQSKPLPPRNGTRFSPLPEQ